MDYRALSVIIEENSVSMWDAVLHIPGYCDYFEYFVPCVWVTEWLYLGYWLSPDWSGWEMAIIPYDAPTKFQDTIKALEEIPKKLVMLIYSSAKPTWKI